MASNARKGIYAGSMFFRQVERRMQLLLLVVSGKKLREVCDCDSSGDNPSVALCQGTKLT